jgi:hypothetical protein
MTFCFGFTAPLVSVGDGTTTRYNLRRKSTLGKGSASRMRIANEADTSPVRKMFKSDSFGSPVLLERDENPLAIRRDSKPCSPKFYVENCAETRKLNAPLQKTNFELVWSTIKNLNVDAAKIVNSRSTTLIRCGESILRTAFEFNAGNGEYARVFVE